MLRTSKIYTHSLTRCVERVSRHQAKSMTKSFYERTFMGRAEYLRQSLKYSARPEKSFFSTREQSDQCCVYYFNGLRNIS
jgi:hypothetical protein